MNSYFSHIGAKDGTVGKRCGEKVSKGSGTWRLGNVKKAIM